VLLDYDVPAFDGAKLAARMRTRPGGKASGFVLTTPGDDENRLGGHVRACFDACLAKPLSDQSLNETLERVLSEKRVLLGTRRSLVLSGEPERPFDGVQMLLVDDNAVNVRVAAAMLGKLGCRVKVARNGVEALTMWANASFDAVLMDCQMPEMDGYTATRELRKRERDGSRLPVIAMTASAMVGDRERCLEAGMDDYITKPVSLAVLAETLARWLKISERA
jgi:CheY-like chemotaxis protein